MKLRQTVIKLSLCVLGVVLTPAPLLMSQGLRTSVASPWQGEPFAKGEGGAVFQVELNQNLSRLSIDSVVVKLYSPAQARYYLLSYRPSMAAAGAAQVWRLPVGKYKIYDMEFRSKNVGVSRWDGGSATPDLNIQAERLANFGRWYAIALPNKAVRVIFRDQQSSPTSPPPMPSAKPQVTPSQSSTGNNRKSVQDFRSLGQGERPVEKTPGSGMTMQKDGGLRAVYQYQKKLNMSYQVNLLRSNRHSSIFSDSIKRYDQQLRTCFLDRFSEYETLQGTVRFKFVYSGSEQLIKNLVLSENTMGHKAFIECLYWQILAINFPVRENLLGDLVFQFNLQTQ